MTDQDRAAQSLESLRAAIDEVDGELLQLFNRRAAIAQQVADVKLAAAPDVDPEQVQYYRAEREAQVLRRVMAENPGPLPETSVALLFRELMSACLALERTLEVAFLGPEGTFTERSEERRVGKECSAGWGTRTCQDEWN